MPAYLLFELAALTASVFSAFGGRYQSLRIFVPFLSFIVLYEYGTLQGWFTVNKTNLWAVNFSWLIQFLFYAFFMRSLPGSKTKKNIFLGLIIIQLLFFVADNIYLQGFWKLNSYAILSGTMILIGMVCAYFFQLLQDESLEANILTYPFFWIATGVLFSYLGKFIFYASFEYMA